MQARRLVLAIALSMLAVVLWVWLLGPRPRRRPPTTEPATTRPTTAATAPSGDGPVATAPTTTTAPALTGAGDDRPFAVPASQPAAPALGSRESDSPYRLFVQLDPVGGGLTQVVLNRYRWSVHEPGTRYPLIDAEHVRTAADAPRPRASLVTEALRIRQPDETFLTVDVQVPWNVRRVVEAPDGTQRVAMSLTVRGPGDALLARLTKHYALRPGRDDLEMTVRIENLTDGPLTMGLQQRGPVGLPREDKRGHNDQRSVVHAVVEQGSYTIGGDKRNSIYKEATSEEPVQWNDQPDEGRLFAWAAVTNKYFAALMTRGTVDPDDPFGDTVQPTVLLDGPDDKNASGDLTLRWFTAARTVEPGGTREVGFELYLGPKDERKLLEDPVYRQRDYAKLVTAEKIWCAPGALAEAMAWLLRGVYNGFARVQTEGGEAGFLVLRTLLILLGSAAVLVLWFHKSIVQPRSEGHRRMVLIAIGAGSVIAAAVLSFGVGNYGWAVLSLVIIVRVLLHPVSRRGQISMTRMQQRMSVLQPKMEALKEKYANDKQKLNEETMKLYREEGISPFGQMTGCLPMVLQMPIWMALWTTLNTTFELRHAPFILWIKDLAGPDALMYFGPGSWVYEHTDWVPMHGPISSLNILPFLLAISMWAQQKFMPKPSKMERSKRRGEDQMAQQRKIMNFMMFFMAYLFYSAPSGLTLYIMASSIFGSLENWRIRKHIEHEKALEEASPPASRPKPRAPGLFERLAKSVEARQQVGGSKQQKKRPKRR